MDEFAIPFITSYANAIYTHYLLAKSAVAMNAMQTLNLCSWISCFLHTFFLHSRNLLHSFSPNKTKVQQKSRERRGCEWVFFPFWFASFVWRKKSDFLNRNHLQFRKSCLFLTLFISFFCRCHARCLSFIIGTMIKNTINWLKGYTFICVSAWMPCCSLSYSNYMLYYCNDNASSVSQPVS